MGNKVCDYPSLQNCHTNADSGSAGAMGIGDAGLSPNYTLHKMTFEFQSNGFFAKNPSAHFAVGLRGGITRNASGNPIAVNGRGFIIGTLGTDPRNNSNPACRLNMLEVESYHGDANLKDPSIPGNHVYSNTCTDTIFADGLWYKVELYVSSDRKIGVKVYDDQSHLIHTQLMQDLYDYLDPNLTNFFFGHVFENPVTSSAGNWNIIVKNVQTFGAVDSIDNYFKTPLINFSLGTSPLPDNSLVTYNQVKNIGVYVNSFPAARTRIYGCANLLDQVDSGTGCRVAADFRIINFVGDNSYVEVGSSLQLLAAPLLNFPVNVYKLVLRINPESYYNQITLQVDTNPGH
jgi:hypothetical protein